MYKNEEQLVINNNISMYTYIYEKKTQFSHLFTCRRKLRMNINLKDNSHETKILSSLKHVYKCMLYS